MENQSGLQDGSLRPAGGLFRGPRGYRALTPWGPWGALVATFLIVVLSIGGAIVLLQLLGWGRPPVGLPARKDVGAFASGLQVFAVWQALIVVLTLLASLMFGGRIRDVLALPRAPRGWRSYVGAFLTLVLMQIALSVVQYNTTSGDLYADLRPFVQLVRGPDWPLAAAVIGIGAPLSEEMLFRGFLLSALARTRLQFWGAAIIATALWTAMHAGYSLVGILEVFLIGMFFSWLLWRTGSLRVAIVCHAVYNSMVVVALRFIELPTQG